jgi:serine/threonine protein kinase
LKLERFHSLGFIYPDIKLENILADQDGHIRMTDFSLTNKNEFGQKLRLCVKHLFICQQKYFANNRMINVLIDVVLGY